jgi:hypothetical protein
VSVKTYKLFLFWYVSSLVSGFVANMVLGGYLMYGAQLRSQVGGAAQCM